MRFELKPDNRNCSDDTLLEDLREVASQIGKRTLTKADYSAHGRFSPATMQKRFRSWNRALELAGLVVAKRVSIPHEELKAELRRVAEILDKRTITTKEFDEHGSFSSATIANAFGSWSKALDEVGLEVSENWNERTSDEELFNNLAHIWEILGVQPKRDDMHPPLSRFSASTYARRFGTWRNALKAFIDSAVQNKKTSQSIGPKKKIVKQCRTTKISKHKTSRNPSWRLRFLVNRKDNFACRACGRSPANERGVVLHVDHIVPWSKGGETTLENLQTLCEVCNLGKSDLAMNEDGS